MIHAQDCSCDPCLLALMHTDSRVQRQVGWERWYQRDYAAIHGYVARRCRAVGCTEHSDDIIQDAFMIGFRNIGNGSYQNRGKPLCGYLHGIAHNLVREVARLQNRETTNDDLIDARAAEVLALEDTIFLQQVLTLVQEAKARLSRRQQQILDGLYRRGQTSKQVGAALAKSANNVRIMALRAVNSINEYLDRQHNLSLSTDAIRLCLQMV